MSADWPRGLLPRLCFVTLVFLSASCSAPEPESWDGSRSFYSVRRTADPPGGPRPGLPRAAEQPEGCAQVLPLLDSMRTQLATRRPPDGVLDTMTTCLEAQGKLLELVELMHEAVRHHPRDAGLIARLAGAFLALGDPGEALRRVRQAQQLNSDEPEALFLEGLILYRLTEPTLEDLLRARDAWRRLQQVAPEHKGLRRFEPELIRRDLQALEQELAASRSKPDDPGSATPPDDPSSPARQPPAGPDAQDSP